MNTHHPLLQSPLQPGPFHICSKFLAWFSLRPVPAKPDDKEENLSRYNCVKCDTEFEFAWDHSPGVI